MSSQAKYKVDAKGFYGDFGGAFIPEMLHANIANLQERYLDIINDPKFKKDYDALLKDYVGRPTPLYFADRLSKKIQYKYISETRRFVSHWCTQNK